MNEKDSDDDDDDGLFILTFMNEEEGEGQHDRVSAVQKVSTHEMRSCDGQTSSRHQLHNTLNLPLRISVQLTDHKHIHTRSQKTFILSAFLGTFNIYILFARYGYIVSSSGILLL